MSTLRGRDTILGTSMPSLTARDIVKQSGASMERAAELANWPSTNAMGSNSWLNKLEAMLNNKLSVIEAEKGTIYDSAMVYHENFGYFIELFKTYQPYLARIHGGYYEVVKSGLDMQHKIERMQAEIYAAKKEAEEEMLRKVQDLKQTVVVLEKKLERAEMVKEKAVERMREKEDNFKQNQVGVPLLLLLLLLLLLHTLYVHFFKSRKRWTDLMFPVFFLERRDKDSIGTISEWPLNIYGPETLKPRTLQL